MGAGWLAANLGVGSWAEGLLLEAKLEQRHLHVLVDGELFTTYCFQEDQKYPYFYPVNGPVSGLSVTTESSEPYPHHRSLFFACDKVNGGNYWQEDLLAGQIVSQGPRVIQEHGKQVQFVDECLWNQPGQEPVIRDLRTITISAPGKQLRCIDLLIELHPLVDVTIERNNHSLFAGRMVRELSEHGGGSLVNAQRDRGEKGTFGVPSPWCDYYGERQGVVEGMAIMEHPSNPWFPTPWFTRNYGFFSPTPMYWLPGDRLDLPAEIPVRLAYRVVVHAGDTNSAGIAALYGEYSNLPEGMPIHAMRFQKLLEEALAYQWGQSRRSLLSMEKILKEAHGDENLIAFLERAMIHALSGHASRDIKQFLCHKLSEMGSKKAVPVLSSLLMDMETFDMACFALERIPGKAASDALIHALHDLDDMSKMAVIHALGQRKDVQALPALFSLAHGTSPGEVRASLLALGRFRTEETLDVLMEIEREQVWGLDLEHARLSCACALLDAGLAEEKAGDGLRETLDHSGNAAVRLGSLHCLLRAGHQDALSLFLSFLKQEEETVAASAAGWAGYLRGVEAITSICGCIPVLPPSVARPLVETLGYSQDPRQEWIEREFMESLSHSENEMLAVAAVRALGRIGAGESGVPLAWLATKATPVGEAARESLSSMRHPGTVPLLLGFLKEGDEETQLAMIQILATRGERESVPLLMERTETGPARVQKAASKALASLARQEDLDPLLHLMVSLQDDSIRKGVEDALMTILQGASSREEITGKLLAMMEREKPSVRISFLSLLRRLGGMEALEGIRAELRSKDVALRKAAIQTLAEWEDSSPMEELWVVARKDKEEAHRVLALRGMIKQMGMPSERSHAQSVKWLEEAWKLAERSEEKRSILSLLPRFPCDEAIQLAQKAVRDPQVVKEAKMALETMVFEGEVGFDFQPPGSVLEDGFIEVHMGTLFSENGRYGWDAPCKGERDRKIGSALTRDLLFDASPRTFHVKLSNGLYRVRVYLGDMANFHDQMEVGAQGKIVLQGITLQAGEVKAYDFQVEVLDGMLNITFKDGGGVDQNWTCAGIWIGQ